MCNRYRMTASRVELLARFGVHIVPEPDRDVPGELFPKRWAWTVRETGYDGRIVEPMQWGFPPPAVARAPVTNVRNLASPFWRTALGSADRRCLVPVTSFCEWEGEKGSKTARWFDVPSRPIFAFAGVWRPTETGPAMAFLTCEPNSLVAPVHPKAMPVVLDDEGEAAWLRGDPAADLAQPFPAQLMTMV